MPCTAGGTPVTIDRLFGFVKLGTTHSPLSDVPGRSSVAKKGATPAAAAISRYSYAQPSTQTTTTGRRIQL
jgi:hypothetical protein